MTNDFILNNWALVVSSLDTIFTQNMQILNHFCIPSSDLNLNKSVVSVGNTEYLELTDPKTFCSAQAVYSYCSDMRSSCNF